jgi:preprotein translocase subunit YajC
MGILAGQTGGSGISMIIVVIVLIAVMYFLMIRPQNKERKRMQALIASIEPGDAVVTTAGFYGVVIDMTEEDVIVEFGNNRNCRIPMKKEAIIQVEKANAASSNAEDTKAKKDDKK